MSENQNDPLDTLFYDGSLPDEDRETLAKILHPYTRLQPDGSISFTRNWHDLTLKMRLLIYLLARKVLNLKEVTKNGEVIMEEASTRQMEEDTGIKRNSVGPTVIRLVKENLVESNELDGETKYYIPNYLIEQIYKQVTDKE